MHAPVSCIASAATGGDADQQHEHERLSAPEFSKIQVGGGMSYDESGNIVTWQVLLSNVRNRAECVSHACKIL